MRIGITGANGQLAKELKLHFELIGFTIISFSRQELDICNPELLDALISPLNLDFLVNCAAYTDVDSAEKNVDLAFKVNAEGPANLARLCKARSIKLIHISTDSVFSSTAPEYFQITANTCPINVYGRSKDAGELAVLAEFAEGSWVVRTAWIYGKFGGKFVRSIMEKAKQSQSISVVEDQFGQPVTTFALASFIGSLIASNSNPGIYHFASQNFTSRFDFARTIFSLLGSDPRKVEPIATSKTNFIASRPKFSLLDINHSARSLDIDTKPWEDYLMIFLQGIGSESNHG